MSVTSPNSPVLPSSIPTVSGQKTDYTAIQNDQMGQKQFLTLFTTQLQNQNPLDPMDNTAFVAQLAQFSQLEATTSMSSNLDSLVTSLKGDRLLQGASLIGKSVAVPDGPAILKDGAAISGVIGVPNGANRVSMNVYDRNGLLVRSQEYGRQAPGDVTVRWDGRDNNGNQMADGAYKIVATVNSIDGSVTQVPIATPDVVKSVTYSSADNDLILETQSGSSVRLSEVKQVKG